jgi:hypothetical protein
VVVNIFKVVLPLDPCPGRFSPYSVRGVGISYSMTFVIPSVLITCADRSVAAPDVSGAGTGTTLKVAYKFFSGNRRVKVTRPMGGEYYNTILL